MSLSLFQSVPHTYEQISYSYYSIYIEGVELVTKNRIKLNIFFDKIFNKAYMTITLLGRCAIEVGRISVVMDHYDDEFDTRWIQLEFNELLYGSEYINFSNMMVEQFGIYLYNFHCLGHIFQYVPKHIDSHYAYTGRTLLYVLVGGGYIGVNGIELLLENGCIYEFDDRMEHYVTGCLNHIRCITMSELT